MSALKELNEVVIVFDIGSTNVAVVAVDRKGKLISSANFPSKPVKDKSGIIWELDDIWNKVCSASRKVCSNINKDRIKAVAVTTFGADGTFMDKNGKLAYPVISWQCTRTEEFAREIVNMITPEEIYKITGYQIIPFNTILKLMWFKKYNPEVFRADPSGARGSGNKWMQMPGLINFKLTGEFSIDATSGSTMMLMDMANRKFSDRMLGIAGVDSSYFPEFIEPGKEIGKVTSEASNKSGLPKGIPVISAGHDTQFAIIGSGASREEAILSSGTWEILMVRDNKFTPNDEGYNGGLIVECDAYSGLWNPQILMMGSGVLEWVKRNFFSNYPQKNIYEKMINEAEKVPAGADKLIFIPNFVSGTGPLKKFNTRGTILGLNLNSSAPQIYRACLEGLSYQLKDALGVLKASTGYEAKSLRIVGGGSKNRLWNQIKADCIGKPVVTISQKEATVLGASIVMFVGIGLYRNEDEAKKEINYGMTTFEPSKQASVYGEIYEKYREIPHSLKSFYSKV